MPNRRLLVAALVGALSSSAAFAQDKPQMNLPVVEMRAGTYSIRAQVAATPEQRSVGLMHRRDMPQHHRMILAALRAGDEPGVRLAVRTDVTQGLRHLAS